MEGAHDLKSLKVVSNELSINPNMQKVTCFCTLPEVLRDLHPHTQQLCRNNVNKFKSKHDKYIWGNLDSIVHVASRYPPLSSTYNKLLFLNISFRSVFFFCYMKYRNILFSYLVWLHLYFCIKDTNKIFMIKYVSMKVETKAHEFIFRLN